MYFVQKKNRRSAMPANISRVIYRRFFPSVIIFLYTTFFLRVNQIRDSAAVKLQQLPRMGKYIRKNTDTWAAQRTGGTVGRLPKARSD